MRQTFITATFLTFLTPMTLWSGPEAMTQDEARHLISRTGFGASPAEITAMAGMSYKDAVRQIIGNIETKPGNPMPDWVDAWRYPHDQIWALGTTATDLFFTNRWLEITELQHWWIKEMIETPTPLTERLTLFWHDHFATGYDEHESPQWAAQQNRLLRAHAAGNFADLAGDILSDPSMLVYLTNVENSVEAPNENLAREFLELFTLGEGRGYTQQDVVETARALTGHSVNDFASGDFTFDPEAHDFNVKTILGTTGPYLASDLPQIVMETPEFGPFIVEKMWLEFVSDQPEPAEVNRLTAIWRAADWEIAPLLNAMLLSDAFWASENRGTLVKSPVELMVGTVRTLGITLPQVDGIAWAASDLGQMLFFPPNVGGWPDGTEWINDATASGRATMLTWFMRHDQDPSDAEVPMMAAMMQSAQPSDPVTVGPNDLSVGKVFVLSAESWEENQHLLELTLFDVRFEGHHWRSLSFFVDAFGKDEFEIVMQVSDCAPTCFPNWPYSEEDAFGWIWFDADAIAEDDIDWMTAQDRKLLAALMGHLPDLVAAVEDAPAFNPFSQDAKEAALSVQDAQKAAGWVARHGASSLGAPVGQLILNATPPATLGLAGAELGMLSEDEIDEYTQAREIMMMQSATPLETYASAQAWLDATSGSEFDSLRAEANLLAIPLPREGRRMEREATDAEALIRHIILSPYFQLN